MSPWHALFRLIAFPLWHMWMKEEEKKDPDVADGAALGLVFMVIVALLVPVILAALPIVIPIIAFIAVLALLGWLAGSD